MKAVASVQEAASTRNFGASLLAAAQVWPNAEAIVMPGARWTYREFLDRALVVGAAFRAIGLRPGTRVGVLMENSPEYLELIAGAAMAGVVPILFNTAMAQEEIAPLLRSMKARALFVSHSGRGNFVSMVLNAFPSLASTSRSGLNVREAPDLKQLFVVGEAEIGPFKQYKSFVSLGTRGDGAVAVSPPRSRRISR